MNEILDSHIRFFNKVIRLANSNIEPESKPYHLVNLIVQKTNAERGRLFLFNSEHTELICQNYSNNSRFPTEVLKFSSQIIQDVLNSDKTIYNVLPKDLVGLPSAWYDTLKTYTQTLIIILKDDKSSYGILVLSFKNQFIITDLVETLLESTAQMMTLAIKNGILYKETKKRISFHNILTELSHNLSKTIELKRILKIITHTASKVLLAESCILCIFDNEKETLLYYDLYGSVPSVYQFEEYIDKKLPNKILNFLKKQSTYYGWIDIYNQDFNDIEPNKNSQTNTSIINLPIFFQEEAAGALILFNKKHFQPGQPSPGFNNDDREQLSSIESLISGTLENALTFKKIEVLAHYNQKLVNYLSRIHKISSSMMSTVRMDGLFYILTQALTLAQGLNFDRVIIFTCQNNIQTKETSLVGGAYWESGWNNDTQKNLPLEQALEYPSVYSDLRPNSVDKVKSFNLSIPLKTTDRSLLIQAALDKVALKSNIPLNGDLIKNVRHFGQKAHAVAPMTVQGKLTGLIAVDKFSENDHINDQDLRNLIMLANQAGLALENARLYSDLREANENLILAQSRLVESEKLAALGEMATGLAHEIRNPLVSIGGFTNRILKKMPKDDPLYSYVGVVMEEVSRLEKVLNNVLNYSRDNTDYRVEIKLDELLSQALQSLKNELRSHKIKLVFEAEKQMPLILGDDRQLIHVFYNLIYNAVQAMDNGGTLFVKIKKTTRQDKTYVSAEISDTGPGLPLEIIPNIFNPFFTTKATGTGLGLAIANKIINLHHGHIEVINKPYEQENIGASFTVLLPITAEI